MVFCMSYLLFVHDCMALGLVLRLGFVAFRFVVSAFVALDLVLLRA